MSEIRDDGSNINRILREAADHLPRPDVVELEKRANTVIDVLGTKIPPTAQALK